MPTQPRVLHMNELSSTRYADVPLPVRQQLGDLNATVDKDARSGNGIKDRAGMRKDAKGKDYNELDPEHNGTRVLPVTYHLDAPGSPVASEPVGAPGSDSYLLTQARTARSPEETNVDYTTQGNATLAVQQGREHFVSTQREIPGRNERYAHAVGMEDETGASAPAGSGSYALTIPSVSIQNSTDEVPSGNIASVLSWVGDDKDRAQQARDAESAKDNPRSSLIERLDNIIEDDKDK